jgi:predicted  nucleic acid-binding Zn-ribbon protein
MPITGRDVQCSNCGQTWFQHHPDHAPQAQNDPEPDFREDEEVAPPPPPPHAPAEPERKQLDPAIADILRQEAEAEQAARRAARSGALESQPDLGLDMEPREDEADRRARQARNRMARLRGDDQSSTPPPENTSTNTAAALGSRRDLLPDIDEINSTLRSGTGRAGGGAADLEPEIEAPTHERQRRGFRTGFLTVLLVFAVFSALYILAPRLGAAVPALEGPLQAYIAMIDQGRIWLDARIQGLLQSLDAVAADSQS